jgi:hypothetical protein
MLTRALGEELNNQCSLVNVLVMIKILSINLECLYKPGDFFLQHLNQVELFYVLCPLSDD